MCLWRDYRVSFWEQLISSFPRLSHFLIKFSFFLTSHPQLCSLFLSDSYNRNETCTNWKPLRHHAKFSIFFSILWWSLSSIFFPLIGLCVPLRLCFCMMDSLSMSLHVPFSLKLPSSVADTGCTGKFIQWQKISVEQSLPQLAFSLLRNHRKEKKWCV